MIIPITVTKSHLKGGWGAGEGSGLKVQGARFIATVRQEMGSKEKPATMMHALIILLLLATIACDDADDSYSESILLAAAKCGQPPSNMQWLDDLIKESQQDVALSGNIYAVTVDGNIIFIHQPAVMSCFACVMYDCDGERIETTGVDLQKVADAMRPSALIYSPY